jgi:anti-sigma factor RsiW
VEKVEKVEEVDEVKGPHVTDEELLLDYYGESEADPRRRRQAHIEACEHCAALDRELRSVLALVDQAPTMDAPPGFGREMWALVEPQISARAKARPSWLRRVPSELFGIKRVEGWALAGGMLALLMGAFSLGRVWDTPRLSGPAPAVDERALSERLLQAEVEDHLERSQRVLVDLVNADDVVTDAGAADRDRAADLVAAGRLYRRSVEATGDVEMRDLLEDIERVLVDVANGAPDGSSKNLTDVRVRISEQDLLFRLRVAASEMRERERRTRPTW